MSKLTPTTNDARAVRGLAIVAKGDAIAKLTENEWRVPSQSQPGSTYNVTLWNHHGIHHKPRWTCSCPDFQSRGIECKHIHAAKFTEAAHASLQTTLPGARKKPRKTTRTPAFASPPLDTITPPVVSCKFCGSGEVVRNGFKNGKQEYRCRAESCRRAFVPDDGFARLKGDARTVCLALDLYFKGVSLRQIADTLGQFFDLQLSHVTIYRWLNRYVALITDYASTLEPWVGDKWHADEVFTKFGGKMQYLWHVMDADTRYLLVSKVTKQRDVSDARSVMREAGRLADKTPTEIVTDGLPAYIEGVHRELRGAQHTREIHISKPDRFPQNNRVERLNGTIRARQKPARGLKSPKGPLTAGQQAYYNLARPHSALRGKTPAEAAGVGLATQAGESRIAAAIRQAGKKRYA